MALAQPHPGPALRPPSCPLPPLLPGPLAGGGWLLRVGMGSLAGSWSAPATSPFAQQSGSGPQPSALPSGGPRHCRPAPGLPVGAAAADPARTGSRSRVPSPSDSPWTRWCHLPRCARSGLLPGGLAVPTWSSPVTVQEAPGLVPANGRPVRSGVHPPDSSGHRLEAQAGAEASASSLRAPVGTSTAPLCS